MLKTDTISKFITCDEWKTFGNYYKVFDKEIFTIDKGEHKNVLLILHGYFSSSYEYYKVIDNLTDKYRVIIPDLIDFGASDVVSHTYFTIIDQVDYIMELCKQMSLTTISVLGHDYGIALAQEMLARQNVNLLDLKIEEFIYCNGNFPINNSHFLDNKEFLKKDVAKQMIAMLTSFGIYKKTVQSIFYDSSKITDDELLQMWNQLSSNNGRSLIKFIYNYLRERTIFWNRWIAAIIKTDANVKVIWGIKESLQKNDYPESLAFKVDKSKVFWIENSGHFPMLENPNDFVKAVLSD